MAAAEGSIETGRDRLARLVRQAISEDDRLNLPPGDEQAIEILRELLKGVIK